MKISYRTHPVLGLIEGTNTQVIMDSRERYLPQILSGLNIVFNRHRNELMKSVIVVSESFQEAALACNDKMNSSELYKDIGDELSGVLICGKMSIVYLTKQIVVDGRSGRELNIIAFHAGDALNTFVWEGVANYTAKENEDSPDEMGKIFWRIVQMVLMFKKFAQVETKELPAGQRLKDIDCKYTNDTNSNVTYLTSAWFTNLVKSDAFKVRGHFRLQPKKNDKGEWTKELIWINEFQKEGYTAPARKLSEA